MARGFANCRRQRHPRKRRHPVRWLVLGVLPASASGPAKGPCSYGAHHGRCQCFMNPMPAAAASQLKRRHLGPGGGHPRCAGCASPLGQAHARLRILGQVGIVGIGLGLSLGREGPSIQISAVTAQGLSRALGRTRMEERYLITAGASAGLAAAFNAPLAGVMFAYGRTAPQFFRRRLAPSMAATCWRPWSAATSSAGRRSSISACCRFPLRYMWLVVILGIIIGLAGVVFNKGLLNIHYFYDLPVFRNNYMRIAFALCMAGILGYVFLGSHRQATTWSTASIPCPYR